MFSVPVSLKETVWWIWLTLSPGSVQLWCWPSGRFQRSSGCSWRDSRHRGRRGWTSGSQCQGHSAGCRWGGWWRRGCQRRRGWWGSGGRWTSSQGGGGWGSPPGSPSSPPVPPQAGTPGKTMMITMTMLVINNKHVHIFNCLEQKLIIFFKELFTIFHKQKISLLQKSLSWIFFKRFSKTWSDFLQRTLDTSESGFVTSNLFLQPTISDDQLKSRALRTKGQKGPL